MAADSCTSTPSSSKAGTWPCGWGLRGSRAPLPAEGGYFLTTDVRGFGEDDGKAFCLGLPERFGVVAIPSVVFYDDASRDRGRPFVRWAFCKRPELIERAAQLLSPGPVDPGRGYGAAHGHGDAIAG